MNYIVSPGLVYLMYIFENLNAVCVYGSVLVGIAVMVSAMVAYISWDYGHKYGEDDPDYKRYLSLRKILKILVPCFIVMFLISVFLPGKNEMIGMKVASLLTKENVNITVDAVKETVDYVVEAISKIK